MSRTRKITDDKLPRLIDVVRVRLSVPGNKQLAHELNMSPAYLHNIMHKLTAIMRTGEHVSRETLRRALFNDKEFGLLMERIRPKVNNVTLPASANEAHSRE